MIGGDRKCIGTDAVVADASLVHRPLQQLGVEGETDLVDLAALLGAQKLSGAANFQVVGGQQVAGQAGAGRGQQSYRGLVRVAKGAANARNFTQCDSLLLSDQCGAHTFPYLEVDNESAIVEHEATTSKIGEDQIFYCNQRGIDTENAISLIVNGYAKEVLNKLHMEFAVEAQKLLAITLEGSVG